MRFRVGWLCVLSLLVSCGTADAFITRLYPLGEILKESTHVLAGKLEKVDPRGRTAVAAIHRRLKGPREFKRVLMNIGVAPAHHATYILECMKPGQDIIFFYKREGRSIQCVAHTGDTWFQLFAADQPKKRDKVWWRMSHLEIYLTRTYSGGTPRLIELVAGVLAGRVAPPAVNPKAPILDVNRRRARRVVMKEIGGKGGGFRRRLQFSHRGGSEIRGVSWADANGDDLPDLYFCRQSGDVLLINQADGFLDRTSQWGLRGGSRSAGWADYDRDDHPDLLTSNFQLFTNIGARFRDQSKLPAAPKTRNPEGAGWIDYNGDGLPDALITNGEHGIRLYENTGKKPKWFRDVSDRAGLGKKGLGVGNGDFVVFGDYDGDGYTDFFYNLGKGVMARNQGNGTFKLDRQCGIKLADPGAKRGIAAADFDNDGDLDLFVPGPRRAQLYRNNNDGTFTDVASSSGDLGKAAGPTFAAAFGDVNCDGFPDLFVCHTRPPGRLYLGDGRGRFMDVSKAAGVAPLAPAFGACLVDIDGDGDLDLAVNLPDGVAVAINEMPRARGRSPLTVRVHARRGFVGSVVRVRDQAGRPAGMRRLCLAEGPGGQTPPVAHFALPLEKCVVSVCLSDGRAATKTVQIRPGHNKLVFREEQFK